MVAIEVVLGVEVVFSDANVAVVMSGLVLGVLVRVREWKERNEM